MLIDWFTVGAQALNFVILVWLMKRFLYRPILDAIDAREKAIAASLADADAKQADASRALDEFQRRSEAFDQQRTALLRQAAADAQAERKRLLDEARQAADALSSKRQETLRTDAERLTKTIVTRTQHEVFAIARKVLADLASSSLEARAVEVFIVRLRGLDSEPKTILGRALTAATGPALVRSAFELPAAQRVAIQTAVNATFAAEIPLRFETDPDVVCGIELRSGGLKVAWSIADHLTSLQSAVGDLLAPKPTDATTSKAGS